MLFKQNANPRKRAIVIAILSLIKIFTFSYFLIHLVNIYVPFQFHKNQRYFYCLYLYGMSQYLSRVGLSVFFLQNLKAMLVAYLVIMIFNLMIINIRMYQLVLLILNYGIEIGMAIIFFICLIWRYFKLNQISSLKIFKYPTSLKFRIGIIFLIDVIIVIQILICNFYKVYYIYQYKMLSILWIFIIVAFLVQIYVLRRQYRKQQKISVQHKVFWISYFIIQVIIVIIYFIPDNNIYIHPLDYMTTIFKIIVLFVLIAYSLIFKKQDINTQILKRRTQINETLKKQQQNSIEIQQFPPLYIQFDSDIKIIDRILRFSIHVKSYLQQISRLKKTQIQILRLQQLLRNEYPKQKQVIIPEQVFKIKDYQKYLYYQKYFNKILQSKAISSSDLINFLQIPNKHRNKFMYKTTQRLTNLSYSLSMASYFQTIGKDKPLFLIKIKKQKVKQNYQYQFDINFKYMNWLKIKSDQEIRQILKDYNIEKYNQKFSIKQLQQTLYQLFNSQHIDKKKLYQNFKIQQMKIIKNIFLVDKILVQKPQINCINCQKIMDQKNNLLEIFLFQIGKFIVKISQNSFKQLHRQLKMYYENDVPDYPQQIFQKSINSKIKSFTQYLIKVVNLDNISNYQLIGWINQIYKFLQLQKNQNAIIQRENINIINDLIQLNFQLDQQKLDFY